MEAWEQNIIATDDAIRAILKPAMRIAVIGLKDSGPSFDVARYMQAQGHTIIPVSPKLPEVLGERAYKSLPEVPGRIDLVDVFRASQRIMPHAEEALALSARPAVFWMQLGISNIEAAALLARAGIKVVQDRCLMVEWGRLYRL
jgi:predicted CoA-binding protein